MVSRGGGGGDARGVMKKGTGIYGCDDILRDLDLLLDLRVELVDLRVELVDLRALFLDLRVELVVVRGRFLNVDAEAP